LSILYTKNCGYLSVFVEVGCKYNRSPGFLNHSVVVTTSVYVKLVNNIWRFAHAENVIARNDRYTPWAGIPDS